MDIAEWLAALGLQQYAESFEANDIDGEVLADLTDADLREIGVASLGHRKKLLRAIGAVSANGEAAAPVGASAAAPSGLLDVTPRHLAQRILRNRAALVGERKQVTVLFADLKGSTEMINSLDPEEARAIIDPAVGAMMDAVHAYEGMVNKMLGDGIMALFGAPIAHEDHAVRACYAALALQEKMNELAEDARHRFGVEPQARVGLHSGEVVVRAIGNDLSMDYDAIGPTTHLAGRMEQLAPAGHIRLTGATARLAEGFIAVESQGLVPVKGLDEPIEIFELAGVSGVRNRMRRITGSLTRFVGRDREMTALTEALSEARAGRGQIFGVIGEPGVGKSRLYHEFCHGPGKEDCLIIESGSVSYGKAHTYAPIIEFLRSYFRLGPRDDDRTIREKVTGRLIALDRSFASLVAPVLSLFDIDTGSTEWEALEPAARRRQTIDAFRAILIRESEEQPIVAVFEDLHWLDAESLAVLDGLIDSIVSARVLLLVNFRPEFESQWGARSHYKQVRLEALRPENAGVLLDHLIGTDDSLMPIKKMLIENTGGNPFFLEESVLDLIERGAFSGVPGGYALAVPPRSITVPPTVQAVLAARIDRLEPAEKQLLQTAAVVGKDFPVSLLETVSDQDPDAIRNALSALQTAELVQETRLFPEKEYSFKHALSHDTAYSGLLNEQRAALHRRIVAAMEEMYAGRLPEMAERLAYHAFRGADWQKAYEYGRMAGERAAGLSAARAAVDNLTLALDALTEMPETKETILRNIDLRLLIRDALFVLGDHAPVAGHLAEAERLAARSGDKEKLLETSLLLAAFKWQRGYLNEGLSAGQQALRYAAELGDPEAEALARYRVGQLENMRGRFGSAAENLSSARNWFGREDNREKFYYGGLILSFIESFGGWAMAELGRFDEAEQWSSASLSLAGSLDQNYSLSVASFGMSQLTLLTGDWARAADILENGLTQARNYDVLVTLLWTSARLSCALAALGRREEAEAAFAFAEDDFVIASGPQDCSPKYWQARALTFLGEKGKATDLAKRTIERAEKQDERSIVGWSRLIVAENDEDASQAERVAQIDAASAIAGEQSMPPLAAMADRARWLVARDDEARIRALAAFKSLGMPYWARDCDA